MSEQNSVIIVTGAGGNLANSIISCLKDFFQIIPVSRNPKSDSQKSFAEVIQGKVLNKDSMVINCAFPVVETEDENIFKEFEAEYEKLLKQSVKSEIKGFINISSQSVYGEYRENPSKETDELNPQNAYARSKIRCENLTEQIFAGKNINYTNLRLASLISPNIHKRMINKMSQKAINDHIIQVEHSQNIFGFLDIKDAAEGICAFVKNTKPEQWEKLYNLGSSADKNINTQMIAHIISDLCKEYNIDVRMSINSTDKNISRLTDSDKFYQTAKWQPKITLEQSIRSIFKNYLNIDNNDCA